MRKQSFAALAASVTLSMASLGAVAADDASKITIPLPAVMAMAKNNAGLVPFKNVEGPSGLTGWIVKDNASGKNVVVYTTADGQTLLAGMAVDMAGQNLTAKYAEEHMPMTDYSPAYEAFTKSANTVLVGSKTAKAEMTVIYDANCGYCKALHSLVTPAVEAGELRVRYVPVAILGGDSNLKAAGLLAAKDAAAALKTPEVSNDGDLLAKVAANTEMMRKYGFNGTPVVMYMSGAKGSETLNVSPGLPNIKQMFATMGISGQVDKLSADPSLARFLR